MQFFEEIHFDELIAIKIKVLQCLFSGIQCTNEILLDTAKNAAISSNFLVWRFCGKAQSLHDFGRLAMRVSVVRLTDKQETTLN